MRLGLGNSPYNYRSGPPIISIEMDIKIMAAGRAPKSGGSRAANSEVGFALALGAARSGAPPGPKPPPTGRKVGEEVANKGQKTPSQKPDFPSTKPTSNPPGLRRGPRPQADPRPQTTASRPTTHVDPAAIIPPVAIPLDLGAAFVEGDATGAGPAGPTPAPITGTPPAPPDATVVAAAMLAAQDAAEAITGTPPASVPQNQAGDAAIVDETASMAPTGEPVPTTQATRPTTTAPGQGDSDETGDDRPSTTARRPVPTAERPKPSLEDGMPKTVVTKPLIQSPDRDTAPDAVKGGQPLEPRQISLVVRQIADRMQLMALARPKQGVTIRLQPAHLGEITMTVKSSAGSIEAKITATDDGVRFALDQNRQLLGHAMEQRGIKLESVSIGHQPSSSGSTPQEQASHGQQQAARPQTHRHAHEPSPVALIDATTRQGAIRSAVGVDLWI